MSISSWLRGQRPRPKVQRVPIPAGAITHDDTSVLQQRGWRKKGKDYTGPFATPYGTWHGRLEAAGDTFRCFIKDPPMQVIMHHPKGPCFSRSSEASWFRINLLTPPVDSDPSAVVLYIERLIIEAYRSKR